MGLSQASFYRKDALGNNVLCGYLQVRQEIFLEEDLALKAKWNNNSGREFDSTWGSVVHAKQPDRECFVI